MKKELVFIFNVSVAKKMPKEVKFKRYSSKAIIPTRATSGSVGSDLYSAGKKRLLPFSQELITTDLMMKIPKSFYCQIVVRSGLALKYGINVGDSVLNSGFRGIVCIIFLTLLRKSMKLA